MSLPARNREIHLRKTINVWAKSAVLKVLFDLTLDIHNALDFQPDAFYVRTVTYISGNEQNSNEVPVLTCTFTNPNNTEEILGCMSANGSISHPNTLFDYNQAVPITAVEFQLRALITQGVIDLTSLNKSTWFCAMEFIQYSEDPTF